MMLSQPVSFFVEALVQLRCQLDGATQISHEFYDTKHKHFHHHEVDLAHLRVCPVEPMVRVILWPVVLAWDSMQKKGNHAHEPTTHNISQSSSSEVSGFFSAGTSSFSDSCRSRYRQQRITLTGIQTITPRMPLRWGQGRSHGTLACSPFLHRTEKD